MNMLLVMAGGAIGAGLRYQLGRLALRLAGPDWPWGTFAANVLGGFTTFSSFSLEVVTMIERGALIGAAGYALASVLIAVAALFGGLALVRNVAW